MYKGELYNKGLYRIDTATPTDHGITVKKRQKEKSFFFKNLLFRKNLFYFEKSSKFEIGTNNRNYTILALLYFSRTITVVAKLTPDHLNLAHWVVVIELIQRKFIITNY